MKDRMKEYSITVPEHADVEAIIDMHVASWIDSYPNDDEGISYDYIKEAVQMFTNENGHTRRHAYIDEAHDNPDYFFRIAKTPDGKVLGFVDARRDGEAGSKLQGLYVDTSYHGKGLSHALMHLALEWMNPKTDIRLTVVTYNKRAQSFYKKYGFEIVPGSDKFRKGTIIPIVAMIRKGGTA